MSSDSKNNGAGEIYSKKALAKLNRPESFGKVFYITSPTGWIALAAVVISIFSLLIWAFFGVMADNVTGYGIITDDSGVANITPTGRGRVTELFVRPGDHVMKGEVVAIIEQSELEQQIYMQAEQAYDATSYEDMRSRTAQLAGAKEQFQREAKVTSPFDGVIIAQRLRTGDMATTGSPIFDMRIEASNRDLVGMMYVPALTGNKMVPGDLMKISPGAIDATLYGSLVGKVLTISDYPVTTDSIAYWTGNKEFANWVKEQCGGAVMEVRVELTRDDETKSGYLWTTLLGPDREIKAGMTCTASAVVDRKAPIVYAFDKLAQWIRQD